jgi:[acyl-carrier-protein] S-malonyltransferase
MRVGLLCPGQGSQHPGMGRALWERFASVRAIFAEASDVLGRDVGRLCFEGTDAELRATDTTQPLLYVVGYASWQALREVLDDRIELAVAAGHSLGEYTALAVAGALGFADGLRLVAARGRLMQQAGTEMPGIMLAILGLELSVVEDLCRRVTECGDRPGVVVVANDNAPGQIVVSGMPNAVERVGELAREHGARRLVPLATSGAFHSPLMESARRELARVIDEITIHRAVCPVVANCSARAIQEPAEIRVELVDQLCGRVRWTESMRRLVDFAPDLLIELAPGRVLSGLVRRIASALRVFPMEDEETVDVLVQMP